MRRSEQPSELLVLDRERSAQARTYTSESSVLDPWCSGSGYARPESSSTTTWLPFPGRSEMRTPSLASAARRRVYLTGTGCRGWLAADQRVQRPGTRLRRWRVPPTGDDAGRDIHGHRVGRQVPHVARRWSQLERRPVAAALMRRQCPKSIRHHRQRVLDGVALRDDVGLQTVRDPLPFDVRSGIQHHSQRELDGDRYRGHEGIVASGRYPEGRRAEAAGLSLSPECRGSAVVSLGAMRFCPTGRPRATRRRGRARCLRRAEGV